LRLLHGRHGVERTMARNVKDLLAEANSSVPRLSLSEAAERMRACEVLVVDVRDPTKVQHTGKIK
jgi:chloramphenicol 3-O-phosphotransferase